MIICLLLWLMEHTTGKYQEYIYSLCDHKTKIRCCECVYHRRWEWSSQMVGLIHVWEFAGQEHPNKQNGVEKDGKEVSNIMCLVDQAKCGSETLNMVQYRRNQRHSKTGPNTRWRSEVWQMKAGRTGDYAGLIEHGCIHFLRWSCYGQQSASFRQAEKEWIIGINCEGQRTMQPG